MTAASTSTRDPLVPALGLAAWTVAIWTFRIRNIWSDDTLTTSGQVWRTALSLAFTGLAVAVIAAWVRRRTDPSLDPTRLVEAFAGWTVAVWVVRSVQIATADHGAAFIGVHIALAVVSVVLAGFAVRAVRSVSLGGSTG